MNNINPLYYYTLYEAHFWRKLGRYLKSDAEYSSSRYLKNGSARKYVRGARSKLDPTLRNRNDLIKGTAEMDAGVAEGLGKLKNPNRVYSDIDNYIYSKENWENARHELGDEIKDLSGKAWNGIKGIFKRNPARNTNPVNTALISTGTTGGGYSLPLAVGATGLGVYGAKTAIDELS